MPEQKKYVIVTLETYRNEYVVYADSEEDAISEVHSGCDAVEGALDRIAVEELQVSSVEDD